MYAKVFYQIFESSIAEDYLVRHVFMDLLVLADDDGVIDKTEQAIARITNVPLDIVQVAIRRLSAPDPQSRSSEEDGRRLILIDDHRTWGWRIVNYAKYRAIRDEEARRISNRSYKREQRARDKTRQHENGNNQQKEELKPDHVADALTVFAREVALTNQRVQRKLAPVMRQRMHERDMGAYEVGAEMRNAWQEYLRHPRRLGNPMAMQTFFTQGIWLNKNAWITLIVGDAASNVKYQ